MISNPEEIDIRNLGNSIELILDDSQYDLYIPRSEEGSLIGVSTYNYENGSNTETLDYEEIDTKKGDIIASISSNFAANKVGLDLDNDSSIDEMFEPIEVERSYIEFDQYDYDSGSPDDSTDPEIPENPGDGSVTIDISGTEGNNGWLKSDAEISVQTTVVVPEGTEDSSTPILSIKIDDKTEETYSGTLEYREDGKHIVTAYAKDIDGNVLGQASKSFKIDQTNPELHLQVAGVKGENGWLTSDAQLSIGASDETSKLARVDYTLDNLGTNSYDGPVDVSTEGHHSFSGEAEDNAGNMESEATSFKIDKTKPIISNVYLQEEYYWDKDFPIEFDTTDAISGVDTIKATINGKTIENRSKYHFTEPGWHTYQIEVKDHSGWKSVYETKFEVYIPAKITFTPGNLQLDHGNGMATNYIELPEPFEPENIMFSTIETNKNIVHVQDPKYGFVKNPISDSDDNGIPDMMLKFERESLINVMAPKGEAKEGNWFDLDITMFGEWGEYHFKGYDAIVVKNSGYTPPPPDVTKPSIISTPTDGEENVSVDVTPILTFTEPVLLNGGGEINDSSISEFVELKNAVGSPVPFTGNWMKNTLSIQINPTMQLEGLNTYILKINQDSVTDSVYNSNSSFEFSFETENYPIVIEEPLPVPVIEEDDDSGYPTVPPSPTPNPSPTPIPPVYTTPSQEQLNGNQESASIISNSQNREQVVGEVEKSIQRVEDFTELENQSVEDKLNVINDSIDTFMVALAEKARAGIVKQKDLEDSIELLLNNVISKVLDDVKTEDGKEIDKAFKVMSNLLKKAVRELIDVNEIKKELSESLTTLLLKENQMNVDNGAEITDLTERADSLSSYVDLINDSLGDQSSEIELTKSLVMNVNSDSKAEITVLPQVLSKLESSKISLGIRNEDNAGMYLPSGLLKKLLDDKIQVSLEQVESQKKSKAKISNDTAVYEFTLIAGKEEVTQFRPNEITLSIPYKNKMVNPQAYYYDEKKKRWILVKTNDGKAVEVTKGKNVVSFKTPHFTKFKVTDSPISKITVIPSKAQVESGEELQLTVTATSNKKNIDITKADDGTSYSSSNPDLVSVDENGLIEVSKEAKEGTKATIIVKNGTKTSKVTITVALKKVTSVSLTPKKSSLEPGEILQLKVTTKMSDDSEVDVTTATTGTTYSSSNNDLVKVDDNGVVTVLEDAEKGKSVTITASNSKKTSKITITIK